MLGQDRRDPVGTSVVRDPCEHHESAVSFHQGRDLRCPVFSDDESGRTGAVLLRNNPWVRWGLGFASRAGPGALARLGNLVASDRISIVLSR